MIAASSAWRSYWPARRRPTAPPFSVGRTRRERHQTNSFLDQAQHVLKDRNGSLADNVAGDSEFLGLRYQLGGHLLVSADEQERGAGDFLGRGPSDFRTQPLRRG